MKYLNLFLICVIAISCKKENTKTNTNQPDQKVIKKNNVFTNEGHKLVYDMVQKVGNYQLLRSKNDVTYTYTYKTPDGKTDISTEKYIFNGELSYGKYHQHQRTLASFKGEIEQGYNGEYFWLKNKEGIIKDQKAIKKVAFNRPTNFYWFTMFQKLLDPGLKYEHIGKKQIQDVNYDVVKVSFSGEQPTDIYQLYINPNTKLVDLFLFTVADFGIFETPLIMKVKYEKIDGLLIPTKRMYKMSTWNADIDDKPFTNVTWSNIKFNNGFTIHDFNL